MLCARGLAAACKYTFNKGGGGFFPPMRFVGICATQGRGRRARGTSLKRETIATSPAS